MYNNDPNGDCRSRLLQYVLTDHVEHVSIICYNFSGGMEVVLFVISTNMPRQTADLVGGTNFELLISRPRTWSSICKKLKDLCIHVAGQHKLIHIYS